MNALFTGIPDEEEPEPEFTFEVQSSADGKSVIDETSVDTAEEEVANKNGTDTSKWMYCDFSWN